MSDFAEVARQMTLRAGRLAEARAEMRLRARHQDSSRWRAPRLLWPLFTGRN